MSASQAGHGLRIPPCSMQDTQSPALSVPVTTKGHFPEAEKDSVIQIASLVSVHGQTEPAVKNIITLNTCSSIVGAEVPICDSAPRIASARLADFTHQRLPLLFQPNHGSNICCLPHHTKPMPRQYGPRRPDHAHGEAVVDTDNRPYVCTR